jgi:hypothetical protein
MDTRNLRELRGEMTLLEFAEFYDVDMGTAERLERGESDGLKRRLVKGVMAAYRDLEARRPKPKSRRKG